MVIVDLIHYILSINNQPIDRIDEHRLPDESSDYPVDELLNETTIGIDVCKQGGSIIPENNV